MATRYARSTDGSNADSGATWALAKLDMAGLSAIDTAGDTLWFSQAHAESTAGNITFLGAGTVAAPTMFLCGNDGAEPPTALATTATISTTSGSAQIALLGSLYAYGFTLKDGVGASGNTHIVLASAGDWQCYESCEFWIATTGGTARIKPSGDLVVWRNCNIKFAAVGHGFNGTGKFIWSGGAVVSGSSSPTILFAQTAGSQMNTLVENVDFSNFGTGFDIFAGVNTTGVNSSGVIRNCKLPSGWAGDLINSAFTQAGRVEMYNCDAGATNYRLWIEDYAGTIKHEVVFVRTGGASDGVTPISWKMTTNANAIYPMEVLPSPEFVIWNDTTGSSKTLTVEILRDSATNLTDKEIWLDVSYLGSSGAPLGSQIRDAAADYMATAADQATSSEPWTTTGMSNPNTQKLSVTFTPQMKGFFICRVILAKASVTAVYVDPKVTVS